MSDAPLGKAVLDLVTDGSGLERGMRQARTSAEQGMSAMQQSANNLGRALKAAFSVAAILAAGRAIIRTSQDMVKAFYVQQTAEVKLAQIIRTTGEAAGHTTEQMISMAQELQRVTVYGDEAIIGMQGILATFKSIQGDVFARTTELALDLSAAFGQDLKSSAIQLGKALEDPLTGLTALRRIGVSFTEQQKEMIQGMVEAGQVAEAQTVILGVLEGQVGGVARAMAQSYSGIAEQFKNTMSDFQEAVGGIFGPLQANFLKQLQPLVQQATQWINDHANQIINFFLHFPDIVRESVSTAADIIRRIFTADYLKSAVSAIWSYFKAQMEAILTFAWEYVKSWASFVWEPIKTGFEWVAYGIRTAWRSVVDFIIELINKLIQPINALIGGLEDIVNNAKTAGAAVRAFIRHPFDEGRREALFNEIVAGQTRSEFGGIGELAGPQWGDLTRPEPVNFEVMRAEVGDAWRAIMKLGEDIWNNAKQLGADLAAPFGDITEEFRASFLEILNRELPEGMKLTAAELTLAMGDGAEEAAHFFTLAAEEHGRIVRDAVIAGAAEGARTWVGSVENLRGGGFQISETFMSDLMDLLTGPLQNAANAVDGFSAVLNPVTTLLGGYLSVVGPLLDMFKTLAGFIALTGKVIGSILAPIIEIVSKAFRALAELFVWGYNNVFRHVFNVLIGAANVLQMLIWSIMQAIINIVNGIIRAVNALLPRRWELDTLNNPLGSQPRSLTEGMLGEISLSDLNAAGEGGAGEGGGAGATFQQQRPIHVTVNLYDTQVYGGNLREFAVLIREEIESIDELGL